MYRQVPTALAREMMEHVKFVRARTGRRFVARDADFSSLMLNNVVLDDAVLAGSRFTGSSLTAASFQMADLFGADFTKALMGEARGMVPKRSRS